jgi:hypothetical protein
MSSRLARVLALAAVAAVALAIAAGACKKDAGPMPDCANHMKDGQETDVDCGGSMCGTCNQGKHCKVDKDCISKLCNSDGVCSAPSCSDGILNGSESDRDCGGPDCDPCGAGKMCYGDNDCRPSTCEVDGGVCY